MLGDELAGAAERVKGAAVAPPAEAPLDMGPVERERVRGVHDSPRCETDAGEVFAVVVQREGLIPWAGCAGDPAGHEPAAGCIMCPPEAGIRRKSKGARSANRGESSY